MDDVTKHMNQMVKDLKERDVSVRCNRVLTKLKNVESSCKNIKVLVSSYPIKVADSCPLAIEQQRIQK